MATTRSLSQVGLVSVYATEQVMCPTRRVCDTRAECALPCATGRNSLLLREQHAASAISRACASSEFLGMQFMTMTPEERGGRRNRRSHRSHSQACAAVSQSVKMKTLDFVKYQGLGNDFLLVDNRDQSEPKISPEEARKLCDRNFGVGGDGVIFALPGVNGSDYSMRIFNSDGTEPEMCGNGIRCMAKFVQRLENTDAPKRYVIDTLAGLIIPSLQEDGQVKVDMGTPILNGPDVPTRLDPTRAGGLVVAAPLEVEGKTWSVTCVSMGNPHCISFGLFDAPEEGLDVSAINLEAIGPLFEKHSAFPAKTNTEFVQVLSRTHLRMRVWERGAGATLACGTGACALVVAAVLEGRTERKCTVDLPGGPLEIEWKEEDNHVYMTGPAQLAFVGKAYL